MTTAPPAAGAADNPVLGVGLMLGFCVVVPFADALAKILGADFPLMQLIVVRFGVQAVILLPLALWLGRVLFPGARVVWLTFLRTLLHIAGLGMMFAALRVLPLADAVAIAFVMPFLALLMGWFFLGEVVGWRRLVACGVGFLGTLMVVQPSFAAVGWPALLPLGVAVVFTVFMLITRAIAKEIDPVALQGASALMALPLVVPLVLLPGAGGAGPGILGWVMPVGGAVWLFAALGVTGAMGHLLMTWSLRYAPAATLAPMQYLEIPMAAVVGLAIFGEFPNGLAQVGIVVTIAAGLYIIWRERVQSRAAASLSPPPA